MLKPNRNIKSKEYIKKPLFDNTKPSEISQNHPHSHWKLCSDHTEPEQEIL